MVKCCCVLLLWCVVASAQSNESVSDLPPFQIVTELMDPFQVMRGEDLAGLNVNYVRKVFANAKIPLPDILVYPWPRAYQFAQEDGNRLIFPMVRTLQREEKFKWIGKIAESAFYIYGLKSNKSITIDSLNDLKLHKIALMKNDVAYHYFKTKGFVIGEQLLLMSDRETIEKLFFNERLKIIISSPFLMNQQASLHGKNPEDYEQKFHLQDLTIAFYLAASLETDNSIIKRLQNSWPDYTLQH